MRADSPSYYLARYLGLFWEEPEVMLDISNQFIPGDDMRYVRCETNLFEKDEFLTRD